MAFPFEAANPPAPGTAAELIWQPVKDSATVN
jgi:hypothetical protein